MWATLALLALAAGLLLAWHYPLWPIAVVGVFVVWVILAVWLADLWLFAVPAALPLLNFSPWTGWLAFDEFDLLILGTLAAGYARLAWQPGSSVEVNPLRLPLRWNRSVVLATVVAGLSLFGIWRGISDAGGWKFGWFDGYVEPLNSIRVGKSLVFALALWPILHDRWQRAPQSATRHLSSGMLTGLMIVGLAVVWERAAYPGLLEFSAPYRTTALFWEMHVGGAAIDAYLALATPFAAWALWSARSRFGWAMAAAVALLTSHACLTTFSRGVYVAVAAPLVLLGLVLWSRRSRPSPRAARRYLIEILSIAALTSSMLILAFAAWGYAGVGWALLALLTLLLTQRQRLRTLGAPKPGAMALALFLMTEAVVVIGGGTFMRERLGESEADFGARLAHWRSGLGLLDGPVDWLVGLGVGRLPANYARFVIGGEFPGTVAMLRNEGGRHVVKVSGPATEEDLAGRYALTQRVALRSGGAHRVNLVARVESATILSVSVCEKHLLYARQCQVALVRILPSGRTWQNVSLALSGPSLTSGDWYDPRLGMFSLSVASSSAGVEVANVSVLVPDGTELLENGSFEKGLAHWFPAAQRYFLPWHIDNLGLEILIERGALGLAVFVALFGQVLWRLTRIARSGSPFAMFVAASLFGALLIGGVSSLMDVPRIAFLLMLLLLVSHRLAVEAWCRSSLQMSKQHPLAVSVSESRTSPST